MLGRYLLLLSLVGFSVLFLGLAIWIIIGIERTLIGVVFLLAYAISHDLKCLLGGPSTFEERNHYKIY